MSNSEKYEFFIKELSHAGHSPVGEAINKTFIIGERPSWLGRQAWRDCWQDICKLAAQTIIE